MLGVIKHVLKYLSCALRCWKGHQSYKLVCTSQNGVLITVMPNKNYPQSVHISLKWAFYLCYFSWVRCSNVGIYFKLGQVYLNFSFAHSVMWKPFSDSQTWTLTMNTIIQLVSRAVVRQHPLLHSTLDIETINNFEW